MANFPTSLPNANPTADDVNDADDDLAGTGGSLYNHATEHGRLTEEVRAVATKVGIDSSADTTSVDYKINNLGGDLSGTLPNPTVVDDSHAHTTTTISGLDAADVTTGTFAQARLASGTASAGTAPVSDGAGATAWTDVATQTELNTHASDTTTHGTTGDVVGTSDTQTLTNKTISGASNTISNIDHGAALTGLTDDDHTQYGLLAGRSGGQTLVGGTGSGDDLILEATSHATNGAIILGSDTTEDNTVIVNGSDSGITVATVAVPSRFVIHSDDAVNVEMLGVHRHSDTASHDANIFLARSRGTEASETIVADDDEVGGISAFAFDGVDYSYVGQLKFEIDGTPGSNDTPGRIVFATTADGATVTTERMRIDSAGNLTGNGGTISGFADLAVAEGGTGASTASGARTNLGVAIGSDVQAWDAALDDFAGLTQATDTLPYFDSATTMATTSLTAFARTLLDDANAAAAITTLGALAVGDVTVNIQEFSASGTWTKPTNALAVIAVLVGAGGGGAAGNVGAEGTLRYGGGGGMAGAYTVTMLDAADCAATEAVTIGAGGAGGTGGTSATGNPGTSGGNTSFNTTLGDVTALGGNAGSHGAGFTPGAGGGRDQPTGYNIARDSTVGAGLGGAGAPSTGSLSTFIKGGGASWCGGGGGGVNRTAANANESGGAGGNGALGAGGAAGNPGTAGGAGANHLGGGGGGGGSAATANGGAGGTPGGGGGGGGYGITSSSNSGSGGAGANGYAAIFTICAKAS